MLLRAEKLNGSLGRLITIMMFMRLRFSSSTAFMAPTSLVYTPTPRLGTQSCRNRNKGISLTRYTKVIGYEFHFMEAKLENGASKSNRS